MKGLAICHKGVEDITLTEIKELIDEEGIVQDSTVVFATDIEKLIKLTYMGRSIRRTLLLLGRAKISRSFSELKPLLSQLAQQIDSAQWLEGKTFKVVCERIGEHEFNSQQVSEVFGELLLNKHKAGANNSAKTSAKVAMNDPQTVVYVFINHKDLYIGIDFAGVDLSKREYKIFANSSSLNGAIAYSLIRIAKLKHNETMVDPFGGSGVIPIEAALFLTNKSVNFFKKDKLLFTKSLKVDLNLLDKTFSPYFKIITYDSQINYMKAIKKNAQIAGVNKHINVSKVNLEWLDTKLDKQSVDKIITHLPVPSKTVPTDKIDKIYQEFFHQADYILKISGTITFIVEKNAGYKDSINKCIILNKYKLIEEREVMQGQQPMKIYVMNKQN